MTDTDTVTIANIKRHRGVAGQFSYTVQVTYPNEPTETIEFVGDVYSLDVVLVQPSGVQIRVIRPDRFGNVLDTSWVREFFRDDR